MTDDRESRESERGFASDPFPPRPRLEPYPVVDAVLVSVFMVALAGFVVVCGALMRWW